MLCLGRIAMLGHHARRKRRASAGVLAITRAMLMVEFSISMKSDYRLKEPGKIQFPQGI